MILEEIFIKLKTRNADHLLRKIKLGGVRYGNFDGKMSYQVLQNTPIDVSNNNE